MGAKPVKTSQQARLQVQKDVVEEGFVIGGSGKIVNMSIRDAKCVFDYTNLDVENAEIEIIKELRSKYGVEG